LIGKQFSAAPKVQHENSPALKRRAIFKSSLRDLEHRLRLVLQRLFMIRSHAPIKAKSRKR
jgi:hypothetical protein